MGISGGGKVWRGATLKYWSKRHLVFQRGGATQRVSALFALAQGERNVREVKGFTPAMVHAWKGARA